ncbi:kelch repeat and BTB domain-containing protein 11-like [Protopterus annectens]|uniref:kelch repeat and BTB domain-containing protein 11-like n=1 Tax=Protopterus annectens TaxID=7888 RepID=UPI001CF95C20|nr:kelch repeat and BTB domain-containing protein 11-like [Protopterus annectens]
MALFAFMCHLFGWPWKLAVYLMNCLFKVVSFLKELFCIPATSVKQNNKSVYRHQIPSSSRIYSSGQRNAQLFVIETSEECFQVDLEILAAESEYFRALSQSQMKEISDNFISLQHIPSEAFDSVLGFICGESIKVNEENLIEHIEVSSYLLVPSYLQECLKFLGNILDPKNCLHYLNVAQSLCCAEMVSVVQYYLAANFMELNKITWNLEEDEREKVLNIRCPDPGQICIIKKENLSSGALVELNSIRFLFQLSRGEASTWHPTTQLPFVAEKWNFSTAVLYNYLFLIGGYKQKVKRGFEFRMASFRYNPFTDHWESVSSLIKRRRHFSAAVSQGYIFAIGGWYLDCLLAPDVSTSLYTAVERYDPWEDRWTFVSSLPFSDFSYSVSMSHDIPLTASLGGIIYVIGTVQRTAEKLILQYNVNTDTWTELLPTLTRVDASMPNLYFFGATAGCLYLFGGNNQENMVASFSLKEKRWQDIHTVPKLWLAGQGTISGKHMYMVAPELNSVVKMDLKSLSVQSFLPLPFQGSYEVLFELYFPKRVRE